ncbi:HD domain-containing protein [uncultured Prevotella sp.]|uniref:HD domain-containing protein n=1 Tax=uncultured Prevotella sp. TaxID=159272 RepID=UPI0026118FEA|nr:HD domain-containing protein [uncultured Prevotella sp.]
MIDKNVSLDLMEFIETEILPRYANFDQAHRLSHVNNVIRQSLDLARKIGADINMAYTIAAYHDLGLEGPRAIHHVTSGKILLADNRLRRWFSTDKIKIMKEAVEDHRASASHSPRSIYGKIVAEADRELDPMVVFKRTILYGKDHYSEMSKEQQWKRFTEHLKNKYSNTGYIKLWIPGSSNEKKLKEIRDYINNPVKLREIFDQMFEETKEEQ